jgi:hypothetical protein
LQEGEQVSVLCPVVPAPVVEEPLLEPLPPVDPLTDPPLVPDVVL